MNSKPPQLVVDEPAECAKLSDDKARALEREIESIKREFKSAIEKALEKATTRLDEVREQLLDKAA